MKSVDWHRKLVEKGAKAGPKAHRDCQRSVIRIIESWRGGIKTKGDIFWLMIQSVKELRYKP